MASAKTKPLPTDLIAAAIEAGNFTTFTSLVEAANLRTTLSGAGPFTVFAPTDAAFEKFPDATLAKLRQSDQAELLRAVIGAHFAAGQVRTRRFAGKRIRAKSHQGGDLVIDGAEGIVVNGAKVTNPDILAANGVLHGIDRVLWPKFAQAQAGLAGP